MGRLWRYSKVAVLVGLLLVMFGTVLAQFPKLPKVPKVLPEKIPGLDKILKGKPPITTSINDAVTEVPFLDDFDPEGVVPMSTLPRTKGGGFTLKGPANYMFEAQSYCLKVGAPGPGEGRGGNGYLYAPLKGPKEDIVHNILRGSYDHPEIPQKDIQVLLWAILARTKIADMSDKMQMAAAKLLTPKEIFELNGGALGLIPENMMDKAFEGVPPAARRVLEAEARLRQMLTEGTATYEELERVAVLHDVSPPEKGNREVPLGRWSYHPDGYFIRYFPRGYQRTVVELYVPEFVQVERDAKGRITMVVDTFGNRIETDYDDTTEPLSISGERTLRGYAFRSIRFERFDPDNPQEKLRIEWNNTGWTFYGLPTGKGKIDASSNRFPGLKARYEWSIKHKKELNKLDEQFSPTGSLDDIMNLGHYTTALKKATSGCHEEKWDVNSHINLVRKAWQYDVAKREGGHLLGYATPSRLPDAMFASIGSILPLFVLSNPGEDEIGFDLSSGDAQPGKGVTQPEAQSGRGTNMDEHCSGEYGACRDLAYNDWFRGDADCMMEEDPRKYKSCVSKINRKFDQDMEFCRAMAKHCFGFGNE